MPVVAGRLASGACGLRARLELLAGAVAPVGGALGEEPVRVLPVDLAALGLAIRALVPVEAEPPQIVQHAPDRFLGDPAGIGVLQTQHEAAAVVPGEEPREQRAADVAHVERAAGCGREPAPNLPGHRDQAFTGLARVPTPSTSTSTTSPSASAPTPSGVPVRMTSPGSKVMNAVMYSISVATP